MMNHTNFSSIYLFLLLFVWHAAWKVIRLNCGSLTKNNNNKNINLFVVVEEEDFIDALVFDNQIGFAVVAAAVVAGTFAVAEC